MKRVVTPHFGERRLQDTPDVWLRENGDSALSDDCKEPRVAVSRSAVIRHVTTRRFTSSVEQACPAVFGPAPLLAGIARPTTSNHSPHVG